MSPLIIVTILLSVCGVPSKASTVNAVNTWTLFNYNIDGVTYTSDSDFEYKKGAIHFQDENIEEHEKFLIRKNLVPNHVLFDYSYYIVSIPRTRPGIPFTINYVLEPNQNDNPMLAPFPSAKESKNIISVYEIVEDGCERYWFVDTGFSDIPGVRRQVSSPSLHVYQHPDNNLIYKSDIPSNVLRGGISSGLKSLKVDYIFPCTQALVYINDDNGNGIVAFSFEEKRFWRIERRTTGYDDWTFPVPKSIMYYVQNVIRYRKSPNETFVHYRNVVENTPMTVTADWNNDLSQPDTNPRGVLYDRNYESNILFFTNEARKKIFCWNMDTPMNMWNIDELFRLDNDFYISAIDTVGLNFHLMMNKFRRWSNIYNENEVNFADYKFTVSNMLKNSKCGRPTHCDSWIQNWKTRIQGSVGSSKYLVKYVPDEYIEAVMKAATEFY